MSCRISTRVLDQLLLVADISSNNHYQYCVHLCELRGPEEAYLVGGAFRGFQHDAQQHEVVMPIVRGSVIYMDQMRGVLDWIELNVRNAWSVTVDMQHVSRGVIRWSFSSVGEAVMFKLTCRNPSCAPIESGAA